MVSCEDSLETVGDDEFFTSTMNSVELAEPASDDDIELAKQCNDELTQASDDLKKELREIMDMPADPSYQQETVNSEKDTYNSVNTPKEGQDDAGEDYEGDNVSASVQVEMPIKSQAQKNAYEAAISKYNELVRTSMNNYKSEKDGG